MELAPVVLRDDIAVIQGGAAKSVNLHSAWLAPLHVVDDIKYVVVERGDSRLQSFLGQHTDMIDRLIALRNTAVLDTMATTCGAQDDPMQDADGSSRLPKRPKREMHDEIPKVVDVSVEVDGGETRSVRVLSVWCNNSRLAFEFTQDNIELLFKTPVVVESFTPAIAEPNVKWYDSRHSVYCRYYDGTKNKFKVKSLKVKHSEFNEVLQERVNILARQCQQYYDDHHDQAAINAALLGENGGPVN